MKMTWHNTLNVKLPLSQPKELKPEKNGTKVPLNLSSNLKWGN